MQSVVLRPRMYLGMLAGIISYLIFYACPGTERICIAWDVGALVYLVAAVRVMSRCSIRQIRDVAALEDNSRVVILALILLSIGASFVAIAQLVIHAKAAPNASNQALLAALAGATILISWSVTQVVFTLHYAHEFYQPHDARDQVGGLEFTGCDDPDYWDFLYFSTSIGATSQTSDTSVSSRAMRRLVTIHATIAFFFNTAVLALMVNIAASLAG